MLSQEQGRGEEGRGGAGGRHDDFMEKQSMIPSRGGGNEFHMSKDLHPVGKGLGREESGFDSDMGAPHTSDSSITAKFDQTISERDRTRTHRHGRISLVLAVSHTSQAAVM